MKFENSTKQLFKQSKFFALAFAVTVVSCKGPEGEVGPKGDTGATGAVGAQGPAGTSFDKAFENGFFKGTITGTRKDGTAFEEPFEYKTAWSNEGFEKISDTEHSLDLWRSVSVSDDDRNYADIDISITNKDQAGAIATFTNFDMEFSKLLSDRNLFYIGAGTNFVTKDIILPISKANNATYKLVDYGLDPQYYQDKATGESFYLVKDTEGNQIYFSSSYTYDYTMGEYYFAFKHIVNSSGVKSTTSTLWSNVRLYDIYGNEWFGTSTGANLSETINVPADTQEITNFSYNASTGLVTFDYKVNISELRAFDSQYNTANTTMHPLEIKGKFSGTVYNGIVMRKSFE